MSERASATTSQRIRLRPAARAAADDAERGRGGEAANRFDIRRLIGGVFVLYG